MIRLSIIFGLVDRERVRPLSRMPQQLHPDGHLYLTHTPHPPPPVPGAQHSLITQNDFSATLRDQNGDDDDGSNNGGRAAGEHSSLLTHGNIEAVSHREGNGAVNTSIPQRASDSSGGNSAGGQLPVPAADRTTSANRTTSTAASSSPSSLLLPLRPSATGAGGGGSGAATTTITGRAVDAHSVNRSYSTMAQTQQQHFHAAVASSAVAVRNDDAAATTLVAEHASEESYAERGRERRGGLARDRIGVVDNIGHGVDAGYHGGTGECNGQPNHFFPSGRSATS